MAKLLWIFLRNIFEIITRSSSRKMESLSEYHDLKLQDDMANPIIAVIYNTFHPIRVSFHTAYTNYKAAIDAAQGATQALQNLWKTASNEKFDEWDTAVKSVYKRNSDEHKALFPDGHEPFRTGSYVERKARIEAFCSNLDLYAGLDAAKALVTQWLEEYNVVYTEHSNRQKKIKDTATILRVQKKICATAMYSNLGYLIYKFPDQPDVIGSYFDISQIVRSTPKSEGGEAEELTITIPAGKSVEGGFQFQDMTKIHVYNSGTEDLILFTSDNKDQPVIPEEPFIIHPEDEEDIVMYTLGVANNRYFFIANQSENEGEIVISLIE